MQYSRLFDHSWDLVVIEGWFPAIGDFIQMVRINSRRSLVFFFCLDPTYPGPAVVSRMDLDGLLTNSRSVQETFRDTLPTQFVMLAADPLHMSPRPNITREWGAVYVGAGGGMVHYKHLLLDMLTSARCCGLRLHGSHWDEIPSLRADWQGPLPRELIPAAYSSAHTVLATTTDDQRTSGMINNRIFEALSCGGVVISERNPAVLETFGDVVYSIDHGSAAEEIIRKTVANVDSEYVSSLRRRGRAEIVRRHSWHHRVVSILDLFFHVRWTRRSAPPAGAVFSLTPGSPVTVAQLVRHNDRCARKPRLAWIVSAEVEHLSDYLIVKAYVMQQLAGYYCIVVLAESDVTLSSDADLVETRSHFDVIFVHVNVFDVLDTAVHDRVGDMFELRGGASVQKTMAYVYGVSAGEEGYRSLEHYDVLWYRSQTDVGWIIASSGMSVPSMRLQHVFSVISSEESGAEPPLGFRTVAGDDNTAPERKDEPGDSANMKTIVMCVFTDRDTCTAKGIRGYTGGKPYMLLLYGGQWSDWMASNDLFGFDAMSPWDLPAVESYMAAISSTVHVSDGRIGEAESYIAQAEEFIFMSTPPPRGTGRPDKSRDDFSGTVWPFVAAAVGYTRLRFMQEDVTTVSRVYALAEEGFGAWDEQYVSSQVKRGVARLVGVSNHKASITVESPAAGAVWWGTVDSSYKSDDVTVSVAAVVNYSNIVLGRDGQSCLSINGGSKTCVFRETKLFNAILKWSDVHMSLHAVNFISNEWSFGTVFKEKCPNMEFNFMYAYMFSRVDIDFSLMGTVFAEKSYTLTFPFYVPIALMYLCPFEPSPAVVQASDVPSAKIIHISGGLRP